MPKKLYENGPDWDGESGTSEQNPVLQYLDQLNQENNAPAPQQQQQQQGFNPQVISSIGADYARSQHRRQGSSQQQTVGNSAINRAIAGIADSMNGPAPRNRRLHEGGPMATQDNQGSWSSGE